MGSYGSKWKHGWIPLNAAATAIKAKQLRGGDKEHHSAEHHGGFQHIVAHTGSGRHGSLIVDPSGAGHYKVFDTRAQAIGDGAEHLATLRGAHNAAVMTAANHRSETPAMQKVIEHAQDRHRANEAKRVASEEAKVTAASRRSTAKLREAQMGARVASKQARGGILTPDEEALVARHKSRAAGVTFTRREMMLPGSREDGNGSLITVRPSMKMHNAGHRFPEVGGPSPMVEHDQFAVEHSNGAHLGHIDTNGGLHITGPGLPRHEVKNVKQAIAGLHANYTIRQGDQLERDKAEGASHGSRQVARDYKRGKAYQDAYDAAAASDRAERGKRDQEIRQLHDKLPSKMQVEETRTSYGKSHEERVAGLKALYAQHRAEEIKSAQRFRANADAERRRLFEIPSGKRRVTKSDTPTMEANRAKIARATERSQPLELSGTFGEAAAATIREGLPVTHGGVAGHVIARYGQTFDTFHPRDEQGRGGYYMRHEITTRRGRKGLNSRIAQHSGAKAG